MTIGGEKIDHAIDMVGGVVEFLVVGAVVVDYPHDGHHNMTVGLLQQILH